jgi:hypothetical protein
MRGQRSGARAAGQRAKRPARHSGAREPAAQ